MSAPAPSPTLSFKPTGTLPIAVLVSMLLVYIASKTLDGLGVDENVSDKMGISALGTVPYVDHYLQRIVSRRRTGLSPAGPVTFATYGYSPARVVVYGISTVVASMQLIGLYVGYMGGLVLGALDMEALLLLIAVVLPGALSAVMVVTGIWIGAHARTRPAILLIIVGCTAQILGMVIDVVILGTDNIPAGMLDVPAATWVYVIFVRLVIPVGLGLVGVWHGKRRRLGYFFGSSLKHLPRERQQDIVQSTEDEVARHVASKRTTSTGETESPRPPDESVRPASQTGSTDGEMHEPGAPGGTAST